MSGNHTSLRKTEREARKAERKLAKEGEKVSTNGTCPVPAQAGMKG
jgi:hypothetical protein